MHFPALRALFSKDLGILQHLGLQSRLTGEEIGPPAVTGANNRRPPLVRGICTWESIPAGVAGQCLSYCEGAFMKPGATERSACSRRSSDSNRPSRSVVSAFATVGYIAFAGEMELDHSQLLLLGLKDGTRS
jgi:hypothetical protein